jgi:hypothetical protein
MGTSHWEVPRLSGRRDGRVQISSYCLSHRAVRGADTLALCSSSNSLGGPPILLGRLQPTCLFGALEIVAFSGLFGASSKARRVLVLRLRHSTQITRMAVH